MRQTRTQNLIVMVRNPIDRAHSHWFHFYSRGTEKLRFEEAIEEDVQRIAKGLRYETREEIDAYYKRLLPRPAKDDDVGPGPYRTYIDSGYYMNQIERYLQLFDRKNLLVLLFDDLVLKQTEVFSDVMDFLEIERPVREHAEPIWTNRARPRTTTGRLGKILQSMLGPIKPIVPPAIRHLARTRLRKRVSKPPMRKTTRIHLAEHYRPHNDRLAAFLDRDLSSWK